MKGLVAILFVAGLWAFGCTPDQVVKPAIREEQPMVPTKPDLKVVKRPVFDPDKPAPCESHTACYLTAKDSHQTGKKAGYQLALVNCEYYRGRYQLEKFYGLCLLILGDSYRHLNNFDEAISCYQRFLDTQPEDQTLALQAQQSISEVETGKEDPHSYADYLDAVAKLSYFSWHGEQLVLEQAKDILTRLHKDKPDWELLEKVSYLLLQINKLTEI